MAADGRFVITWASQQDINLNISATDYGIYARMFNADGSGTALGEFRINAYTLGGQVTPAIAVNATDNFAVVWAGPDVNFPKTVDIYSRFVDPPSGSGTTTAKETFALSGPTSGSYAAGSSVTIAWTAGGVVAGSTISLCYDTDNVINGNEKWIEIDAVTAADGTASYTWNTTGVAPGTYYVGGYL